jgi:hypothetical protein
MSSSRLREDDRASIVGAEFLADLLMAKIIVRERLTARREAEWEDDEEEDEEGGREARRSASRTRERGAKVVWNPKDNIGGAANVSGGSGEQ